MPWRPLYLCGFPFTWFHPAGGPAGVLPCGRRMSTTSSPSCFSIIANDWIFLCIVEPSQLLVIEGSCCRCTGPCFLFYLWWMLIDLFPWLSQNTTCPEMAPSTGNWALIHFSVEVPSFHMNLAPVKLNNNKKNNNNKNKRYNWGEVGNQYIKREGQVILRMFKKVKVIHIYQKLHIIPLSIYYFIIS